jgi:hypothetical protein
VRSAQGLRAVSGPPRRFARRSFLAKFQNAIAARFQRPAVFRGRLAGDGPCLELEPPKPRIRAHFIRRAIFWSVGSGIYACFLVIAAFTSALLEFCIGMARPRFSFSPCAFLTAASVYPARDNNHLE